MNPVQETIGQKDNYSNNYSYKHEFFHRIFYSTWELIERTNLKEITYSTDSIPYVEQEGIKWDGHHLLWYTQNKYVNYTCTKSLETEKTINYDKFLGTLKNDTGSYYLGAIYDPNGKEVKYREPDGKREILVAANQLSDSNGQRIDRLISYLSMHENTQMHEQLMMYYWNKYTNRDDLYDANIDWRLDIFDTYSFKTVSRFYGKSAEEKIWWALQNKGYSKIATAAVLGYIDQQSGFNSEYLEDNDKVAMYTEESYTNAIDNGTYTREDFISDGARYGLAGWKDPIRKGRLYDYAKSLKTSISNLDMQIEFLLAEITGNESIASKELRDRDNYYVSDWEFAEATSNKTVTEAIHDATEAFDHCFENYKTSTMKATKDKAVYYYEYYKDEKRPAFEARELIEAAGYVFPHYYQEDYYYVSMDPVTKLTNRTIASSGCGPTSMAMILAGLKNDPSITPETFLYALREYYGSYTGYYLPRYRLLWI